MTPRKALAVGLGLVFALATVTFLVDVTTIRADPSMPPYELAADQTAFPGELIHVRLGYGWSPIENSNPDVVRPLAVTTNPDTGWFIAGSPGQAILHAVSEPCPRCEQPAVLWRMTVNVRIVGG